MTRTTPKSGLDSGVVILPRLGMGCMRLSTAADRDETRAVAVIHAALDAGVRLLDTADAYARDASEIGHNERLIARALQSWTGDRGAVVVATKGGMIRPGGLWVTDGRARHLAAVCGASRAALGVERLQLYQLHAPDPRTPLSTSVRALEDLRRDGLIEAIGLEDLDIVEGRGDVLRRYRDDGWRVIGLSWQPEIAGGTRTPDEAEAVLAALSVRLGIDMDTLYCPHAAGPPMCWCRKPLPGLAVVAIERYRLDPGRCLLVGDGRQDPGFARRLGFAYRAAPEFFVTA